MKDYFNQWLSGKVDAYDVLDFSCLSLAIREAGLRCPLPRQIGLALGCGEPPSRQRLVERSSE